jgi:hypothetical protein
VNYLFEILRSHTRQRGLFRHSLQNESSDQIGCENRTLDECKDDLLSHVAQDLKNGDNEKRRRLRVIVDPYIDIVRGQI